MKELEHKMPTVLNQGCSEEMLGKLNISLDKSMKKAIPKSKRKLVHRNNLWWNDRLKQLRKTVGKSYKSHQKSLSEGKATIFKDIQKGM